MPPRCSALTYTLLARVRPGQNTCAAARVYARVLYSLTTCEVRTYQVRVASLDRLTILHYLLLLGRMYHPYRGPRRSHPNRSLLIRCVRVQRQGQPRGALRAAAVQAGAATDTVPALP